MYFFSYVLMTLLMFSGLFLIGLILLQRGRGGGLAGAFGGMGGQSAFGTKAGDVFTRITIGVATAWILLCAGSVVALQYSTAGRIDSSLFKEGDDAAIKKAAPADEDWENDAVKAPAAAAGGAAAEAKKDEAEKPADDKPAENKPEEKKPEPAAEKPAADKPADAAAPEKPGEPVKPAEPAADKPAEEPKPAEPKPAEPAPAEQKPEAENKPAEQKPEAPAEKKPE